MRINGSINLLNQFCLLEVEVSKEIGQTYEDTERVTVTAMIDTGATRSAISKNLTDKLELSIKGEAAIRGFDPQSTSYALFYLFIPELTTDYFPTNAVIVLEMEKSGFDIIIGCDYLKKFLFERDGVNQTFSIINSNKIEP
jgi:hypothetical protein